MVKRHPYNSTRMLTYPLRPEQFLLLCRRMDVGRHSFVTQPINQILSNKSRHHLFRTGGKFANNQQVPRRAFVPVTSFIHECAETSWPLVERDGEPLTKLGTIPSCGIMNLKSQPFQSVRITAYNDYGVR